MANACPRMTPVELDFHNFILFIRDDLVDLFVHLSNNFIQFLLSRTAVVSVIGGKINLI